MIEGDLTVAQLQLLKARATKFANFKPHNTLSSEHGLLNKDIDQCLAFGLLKHGYDESLPRGLSSSVFVPFNKCLVHCMQNGVNQNKEFCEICDSISDLAKHSSSCCGHPEACPTCKTFFNILEYHLLKCYACDMHLCVKLKLKLLKHSASASNGGLVDLWPKIQQYISRLFPLSEEDKSCEKCTSVPLLNSKQALNRYPSVFDSATPPASPGVVSRGLDQEKGPVDYPAADANRNAASENHINEYHRGMDDLSRIVEEPLNRPLPPIPNYSSDNSMFMGGAAATGYGNDVYMSTDLSSLSSLTLSSIGTRLKASEGFGSVIMGEPRQLRTLADHWNSLKIQMSGCLSGQSACHTDYDGVILNGKNSGMMAVSGQYKKNEQWRKITYVGRGVAGKCYLAVDLQTMAQFAVKKITLQMYQPEELVLWSELEHPNLVQLYGAIRVKNKIYIFSEFYAAGNMAEFIDGRRMLDQWLSVWFLSQLLEALDYLKKKDILHEDIKADNIFLKPESFQVGLGDFGLSRKGKCPPNSRPVGGQQQWSPEKAKSEGHGYPADVWAANCTFVHMLSGDPPWKRRFPEVVILHFKIATDSPPVEDIPPNLQPIVDHLARAAYIVNPDERPSARDLLQHDCFNILYNEDHSDPAFRSHIPILEEDMEFEGCDSKEYVLSYDELLEGVEDKQRAIDYINQLCSSMDEEESDSTRSSPSSPSSASTLRKQFSIRAPPMESIIEDEELDISLDTSSDMDLQRNILERRHMPAIPPLDLYKRNSAPSVDEKRSSFGNRSNSSPSSTMSGGEALFNKRDTLLKRETSPAIIVSSSSNEELEGLIGEKNIFDLNPATSGYVTGPDTGAYIPEYGLMSSSFHQPNASLSNQPDGASFSASLREPSSLWLGASDHGWNMDPAASLALAPGSYSGMGGPASSATAPLSYTTANDASLADNRMHAISLKPDTSGFMNGQMEEKFDLSSSLQILKDSYSLSSSIDPRSILTIVNGITRIDATEVLIRGNETWQDIVEQNMNTVMGWKIEDYTYFKDLEGSYEINLTDAVPKEKTNAYILPATKHSTWCVRDGKLLNTQFQ